MHSSTVLHCCVYIGVFRAIEDSLTSSRCAVVVLCPTFIDTYSNADRVTRFHLENLITEIDIIYIVFGELDVASVIQQSRLGLAITSSIKNSCRLKWGSSWPTEDDAKLRQMDTFYRDLKLAIPNRRRRTTAEQRAAAAITPATRQASSESYSASDGRQHLLPTTA